MGAGNKVGEAYVEISADRTPLSRGLSAAKTQVSGWVSGLSSVAGQVGAVMGAAGIALAGIGAFKSAIMGAANLNETLSRTGVVFGDATGTVTAFADDMAARFGTSRQSMLDAASSLGLIGKAAGLSQPEAAGMSVALAKLADDASSFYNVPLDEALQTIRSALVGESEPIRKFGVLLNEDAVKAEALRLGLVKVGGALTEQAKVMARVSLIQKGMVDATGDHERTAGSFVNKLREVQGRLENIGGELGQALLPFAEAAAMGLNGIVWAIEQVINAIKAMINWWKGVPAVADKAGKSMGDAAAKVTGGTQGKPKEPTAAEKSKATDDKAQASVASNKEADALKQRIAVIQEEQRLEALKEKNRKFEIEILKARRLDSLLISEKGPDGKVRQVVGEANRARVNEIMSKVPNAESLVSAGKDKLANILGAVAQLKQTVIAGAAIGANMLTAPQRFTTGVTNAESYAADLQNAALNQESNDKQKEMVAEQKKAVAELQAIKEGLLKQGKGVVAAVFG